MCGIAGLFHTQGKTLPPTASQTVERMTNAIWYRGPDGHGIWQEGPCALGHRRLSIIDLHGGAQPMVSCDHTCTIVFNGEIYNFAELKKELISRGSTFRTNSDTEVLLNAYQQFGRACLDRLEGMFAFAIYDAKKRALFLARDRFGKKPLFYAQRGDLLYFASELTSFRHIADLSLHLDAASLARYLSYEYVPGPSTIYQEVRSLLPAHFAFIQGREVVSERYWSLPKPSGEPISVNEASTLLREKLTCAVARRMISDVPLGVFLSGGLDSSIVTALMSELSETQVQTFSIGFAEESYDESPYALCVAKHFNTLHHEERLEANSMCTLLPELIERMDLPMADASLAPCYLLSHLTRKHVTVALGGDGSDELWAGYENYFAFAMAEHYRTWPKWLRRGLIEPLSRLLPGSAGYVNLNLAMKTFLHGAHTEPWLRIQELLRAVDRSFLPKLLSKDLVHTLGSTLNEELFFASTRLAFDAWSAQGDCSPLARAFHVYTEQYLPEDILVKIDRASMLNSLEVRAPFLDRDVAEFTARLPLDFKLHGLRGKYLLRKTFAQLLPKKILSRPKRGFQIPVAAWLRKDLVPLFNELCSPKRLKRQGLFNPVTVQQLFSAHRSAQKDLRKPLWTILILELWLATHGDPPLGEIAVSSTANI